MLAAAKASCVILSIAVVTPVFVLAYHAKDDKELAKHLFDRTCECVETTTKTIASSTTGSLIIVITMSEVDEQKFRTEYLDIVLNHVNSTAPVESQAEHPPVSASDVSISILPVDEAVHHFVELHRKLHAECQAESRAGVEPTGERVEGGVGGEGEKPGTMAMLAVQDLDEKLESVAAATMDVMLELEPIAVMDSLEQKLSGVKLDNVAVVDEADDDVREKRYRLSDDDVTFEVAPITDKIFSEWQKISSLHSRTSRDCVVRKEVDTIEAIPESAGVYELRFSTTEKKKTLVAYCGKGGLGSKSKNLLLRTRLNAHAGWSSSATEWIKDLVNDSDWDNVVVTLEARYTTFDRPRDADLAEAILLYKYAYLLNAQSNELANKKMFCKKIGLDHESLK